MQVNCPRCQEPAEFPDSLAGSEARCPTCGGLIPLPVPGGDSPTAGAEAGGSPEASEGAAPQPPATPAPAASLLESYEVSEVEEAPSPGAPRPLWPKVLAVAAPLLLILGGGGIYLAVHLSRAAHARELETRFAAAEDAYLRGNPEECERLLAAGLKLISDRPAAVKAERAGDLKRRAGELRNYLGRWRQARDLMKRIEVEPVATRRRLQDHLKAAVKLGKPAEPVARLIAGMVERAYQQELSERRGGLESHLKAVEAQLEAGEFDAVRKALKLARGRIAAAPEKLAEKLRESFSGRLRELDAVLARYDEAAGLVRKAAPAGPRRAAVEAQIRKRMAALEAATAGEKGLAVVLRKFIAELQKDARPLPGPLSVTRAGLEEIAKDFAAAAPGLKLDEKSLKPALGLFRMTSPEHKYRVAICSLHINRRKQTMYVIEVDGIRLAYPVARTRALRRALVRYEMAQAPILAKTLKDSGHEAAWSESPWRALLQGPAPAAILPRKAGPLLCVAGKVWNVRFQSQDGLRRRAALTFMDAARKLEEAIGADRRAPEELRSMLALVVRASHQPPRSSGDFLPGSFCREAVARGYIEKNAPQLADRLKSERAAYRIAYLNVTRFFPDLAGKTAKGDEITWGVNTDGRSLWRIYDKAAGATTFALQHNDEQFRTQFFVHSVFAGRHPGWPATELPKAVRMVHQSTGEVASWDPETDKLTFEAERWHLAAEIDNLRPLPAHFGRPEWRFPPHVLLTDSLGSALGLVTPHGRLDMPEFGKRRGAERRKAQEAFLNKCARVLKTPGELHLFFRYFVKYCYDSPLTDHPFLVGDRQHTGDVHQDAYQTLDRKIAGRFVADCDDLAEYYQEVTKRQSRLSFVLGMPSHAVCGFVEKKDKDYVFSTLDTGPPRQFRGRRLDSVIEAGTSSFDEEHTEAFDPNSVQFLLRFAGEQTRTPYFLGTRMFVDPEYAKTMIRVQRDWHFAYIVSGRNTMAEMVKHDADPPNCFELAAFHRELCEWPLATRWARKGIDSLPADDVLGRLTESLRLAGYLDRSEDRTAAAKLLIETGRKIEAAEKRPGEQSARFAGLRFSVAAHLAALKRPWAAWKVASPAAKMLTGRGRLGGDNVGRLCSVLFEMKELERGGRKLTEAEGAAAKELDALLEHHFARGHFKEQDTFRDLMDKYGDLAIFYAARGGREHALKELLREGPYPAGARAHQARRGTPAALEADDWKWARLSLQAYGFFLNDALDERKPVAERRTDEAVRVVAALEKAVPEIRKQGALGGMEFAILAMRVRRDAITKNWAGMESAFKLMRRRDWGRLYRLVAMSFGQAAAYMSAGEFEAQFRKFCDYKPPLPHYLRAAYAALSVQRPEHALRAAKIAAERLSDNPDIQREYKLLKELLEKRGVTIKPLPEAEEQKKPAEDEEKKSEPAPEPSAQLLPRALRWGCGGSSRMSA